MHLLLQNLELDQINSKISDMKSWDMKSWRGKKILVSLYGTCMEILEEKVSIKVTFGGTFLNGT